jgi:hypothetical protein
MRKMETMTISELSEQLLSMSEDEIVRVTFEEDEDGGEEV